MIRNRTLGLCLALAIATVGCQDRGTNPPPHQQPRAPTSSGSSSRSPGISSRKGASSSFPAEHG